MKHNRIFKLTAKTVEENIIYLGKDYKDRDCYATYLPKELCEIEKINDQVGNLVKRIKGMVAIPRKSSKELTPKKGMVGVILNNNFDDYFEVAEDATPEKFIDVINSFIEFKPKEVNKIKTIEDLLDPYDLKLFKKSLKENEACEISFELYNDIDTYYVERYEFKDGKVIDGYYHDENDFNNLKRIRSKYAPDMAANDFKYVDTYIRARIRSIEAE